MINMKNDKKPGARKNCAIDRNAIDEPTKKSNTQRIVMDCGLKIQPLMFWRTDS